ncbi:MAG: 30S ribosomal protein S8 [Candidatus Blackburnbacteria bacterium]|nr:30S ribosomal protein S8 [Candidatus Blackburnbacteria bacterium]
MITDPVGDLLARVRNAALCRGREVLMPYSRLKLEVSKVLEREGYLSEVKKIKNELSLTLAFKGRRSVVTGIKNVSRPGLRIYRKSEELPRPLGGAGISIISTPQGVMSNKEARKKGLGGEVLGEVW